MKGRLGIVQKRSTVGKALPGWKDLRVKRMLIKRTKARLQKVNMMWFGPQTQLVGPLKHTAGWVQIQEVESPNFPKTKMGRPSILLGVINGLRSAPRRERKLTGDIVFIFTTLQRDTPTDVLNAPIKRKEIIWKPLFLMHLKSTEKREISR
jgi:hypothetical protein